MRLKLWLLNFGSFVLAIPNSYATILFSDSTLLGLVLLIVTFFSPLIGLSGLLGLVTALLLSRIAGFEPWDSKSGVVGFNSLILAMSFAYYYPTALMYNHPLFYIGAVVTASIFTMFLYLVLSYFTQSWLRMPSMSLAFSITALMLWFYFAKMGYLANYEIEKPLLLNLNIESSAFWRMYFICLGSIFFVPTVLSGILIASALLIISRIAFSLSLLGWTLCYYLLQISGIGGGSGMFYPGFNIILIVIAVGSVFLLPGKSAWLLAAMSAIFGLMITILMSSVYHYYNPFTLHHTPLAVPVFAFPLNIIVLLVVFTLRLRIKATKPQMNDYNVFIPERALQLYQERFKRFGEAGVPQFCLPVNGEWKITQGHHGSETHKLEWAYAWDFEIEDNSGKKYSEDALQLTDYYTYNKPVFSSAAGYIAKVSDGVLDNSIGNIDPHHNWGNYITISHGFGLYSLYAHLKNGSIMVKEGDYVAKGAKLASIGNSGRSPVPHLHFQIQLGVVAGSKTLLSHLVNYKLRKTDGSFEFISSGIPHEGDTISALIPEARLQDILCLPYGQELNFTVKSSGKERHENWSVELDFAGTFRIVSSRKTSLEFSVYNGIYNALSLKGRRNTALYAFAMILSRFPYTDKYQLSWQDEPALSISMNPWVKDIALLLMPIYNPLRVDVQSQASHEGNDIKVQTLTTYRLLGIAIGSYTGHIVIDKYNAITSLSLKSSKKILIWAENTKDKTE